MPMVLFQHMHVHILPRKPGDFEQNDDMYYEVRNNCSGLKLQCFHPKHFLGRTFSFPIIQRANKPGAIVTVIQVLPKSLHFLKFIFK